MSYYLAIHMALNPYFVIQFENDSVFKVFFNHFHILRKIWLKSFELHNALYHTSCMLNLAIIIRRISPLIPSIFKLTCLFSNDWTQIKILFQISPWFGQAFPDENKCCQCFFWNGRRKQSLFNLWFNFDFHIVFWKYIANIFLKNQKSTNQKLTWKRIQIGLQIKHIFYTMRNFHDTTKHNSYL